MIVRLATHAMGTRWEFALSGEREGMLRAIGEAALEEVLLWHARLGIFAPDSLVNFIHRTAHERPVRVDEDFWELLLLCEQVWRQSGGLFDPTVGGLMRRAGFHPGDGSGECGWGRCVHLDEATRSVMLSSPDVRLDFGAVAKGFALQRCTEIVRDYGITTALLHGGTSSIAAIGAPNDEEGWRVRVVCGGEPMVVTLRDQAMSVSAPRGRMIGEMGHVIDPRSGHSTKAADTAAVICDDAALADAWSTAVLVNGERIEAIPGDMKVAVHREGAWTQWSGLRLAEQFREVA